MQGQIIRKTEKALLVSFINGRENWVPKSVIHSEFDVHSSSIQEFAIAKWFIDKNNLILEGENPNIIGESGSEAYIKHQLLRKGIDGFKSIKDIQKFKRNFKKILEKSTKEEQARLTAIIEELKTKEEHVIQELEIKKEHYKEELVEEKIHLMASEMSSKDQKRVKKIDKILEKEKKVEKPFKKDLKKVKKTEKEIQKREKNFDKSVEEAVQDLRKTNTIIKQNLPMMIGAVGETAAIKELKKLPEQYYILNEVQLSFSKAIRWTKKPGQYVRSCKIDHVVVGPTGIFLIETKNWSIDKFQNATFTPHEQIDRAGYIFFIHTKDRFRQKFPTYNVVATYSKLPLIPYPYVEQMLISDLVNYILGKPEALPAHDIPKIVSWLEGHPHIYNSSPRGFYMPRKSFFPRKFRF